MRVRDESKHYWVVKAAVNVRACVRACVRRSSSMPCARPSASGWENPLELDGNIVGLVPALKQLHLRETRFRVGDRHGGAAAALENSCRRSANHLRGSKRNLRSIRESHAQRDRRANASTGGALVVQRVHTRQALLLAVAVQNFLHLAGSRTAARRRESSRARGMFIALLVPSPVRGAGTARCPPAR